MSGCSDLYNRQYHTDKDPKKDERKTLDALEEGKSADEKQKYEDAACYMVHCAEQMSDGNPAKQAALDSESRGAHDTTQQGELRATGLFKYDPVVDKGQTCVSGLFSCRPRDGVQASNRDRGGSLAICQSPVKNACRF